MPASAETHAPLTTELVCDERRLAELRPAWEGVYEAATGGSNPFLRWTWVWRWWERAKRRRGQPSTRLHLLVMHDAQAVVRAVMPFFLATWGIGPLRFRALRFFGFHTAHLDLRTPLVWPGWEAAAAAQLNATLWAQRHVYDVCVVDGLAEGSTFTELLAGYAASAGWVWGPSVPAFVVPLPATWEALRAGLSHNNRRSVQQGRNALKREGHTLSFEVVSSASELPDALEELFVLHAARAARPTGPRHSDYYARLEDRVFLRSLAEDLMEQGLLQICRLRVDGTVVASRLVLGAGDGLYLYHAGHDPAWARYRVGTTLTAECMRLAIQKGARRVHLGTGADESKIRWRPQQHLFRQLHVLAPTPRGRLLGGVAHRALTISHALRHQQPHRVVALEALLRRLVEPAAPRRQGWRR